jgi:hypothetical protein
MHQEVLIGYVVTALTGAAEYLHEDHYCGLGQMGNLIKLQKAQFSSAARSPIRCGSCFTLPRKG